MEQKTEILETLDVEQRLEKVLGWAKDSLAEMTVKNKIKEEVQDSLDKRQREFILRQQLDAIRKELGELTGEETEGTVVEEYRSKIADANMPEGPRKEAERELGRLERTSEQSPEYGWIRTYLDWMTELPWDVRTDDNLDITEARKILDQDHTGLEDVKDRIIEYLAVRKLRADRGLTEATAGRGSGAILTLVGPPGVGKTSLGESVARALGRKFVRVSLGGIHDEAEIRGHRRTYVGALPGRIVRALKEAGTKNPVMMLDEIDKVGADWRGDPSSALLEVLDPAQNHTFRDHYLEVDLDLSEVLFVTTANVAETIPGPLLDRMEVIRLDGYTEDEKVAIARDHLMRRQLETQRAERGRGRPSTDAALRVVVGDYTREAGVRNLERELGKLLRKVATKIASGEFVAPVTVDEADVKNPPRPSEVLLRGRRARVDPRRRDGTGRHRNRRGRAVHRSDLDGGRAGLHADRPARRRDEGIGADRAVVRARARGRTGHRSVGYEPTVPPPRAGRRRPEGRPERGHRDDDRARVAAHRSRGAPDRRHDRRGHAPGQGASDRRGEAEGPGRAPSRAERGHPPEAQRGRSRRRTRAGPHRDDLPSGIEHRRGAGSRPRACRFRRA